MPVRNLDKFSIVCHRIAVMSVYRFRATFVTFIVVIAAWTSFKSGRDTPAVNNTAGVYIPDYRPTASLFTTWNTLLVSARCGCFFRPKSCVSRSASLVALLLIISGNIESNPGPEIRFGSLNAHSVVLRGPLIQDLIGTHRPQALAVCESWIVNDDTDTTKLDCVPDGFRVVHLPRLTATHNSRGGGLCFVHHSSLTAKPHPLHHSLQRSLKSFECQLLSVHVGSASGAANKAIVVANIYRPPSKTIPPEFFDELSDLFSKLGDCIDNDRFLACGDFNAADGSTIDAELLSLFDVHGLRQHVSTPTHQTPTTSNILDLVIAPTVSDRIASVAVRPSYFSDHELVTWSLTTSERPTRCSLSYSFRNLKVIDMTRFQYDVARSSLYTDPANTADKYAEQIDSVVSGILDSHCPLQKRTKLSPSLSHRDNRWLSQEAILAKRERRRLAR